MKDLQGINKFELLGRGRAAAVVVDEQGIFLGGVEVGRQEVEAVDAVAA